MKMDGVSDCDSRPQSHKDTIPIILANLEGHLVKTNPGAIEELASQVHGESVVKVAGVIRVRVCELRLCACVFSVCHHHTQSRIVWNTPFKDLFFVRRCGDPSGPIL